jgi:hypothetical protein
METRIRRYFAFRKLTSRADRSGPTVATTDESGMISVPYESTSVGRPPVLASPTRVPRPADNEDEPNTLAIRAVPYKAAVAGAAPVIGDVPIRGNGPVKLQTSRRLSSGELLVTTQDHVRTLSDIREGEYIVGRKELNRDSYATSNGRPNLSRSSSPRPSLISAPPRSDLSPAPSPNVGRRPRHRHIPPPIIVDRGADRSGLSTPASLSHSPYFSRGSLTKQSILGPAEIPLPLSPGRPSSPRASLLHRGEEHNSTIQALWKAEYTRLVAIYGQDGVDRNIAALDKDRVGTSADRRRSVDTGGRGPPSPSQPSRPPPGFGTVVPSSFRTPRNSITNISSPADIGSEDDSAEVPSLLSSEGASSFHTKRSSTSDVDVPTTREEVSRMVEDIRKNYLKALETKAMEKAKTRRPKKSRQRASYAHANISALPSHPATYATGRQSWHASTMSNTRMQEKRTRKQSGARPRTSRESTAPSINSSVSMSSLKDNSQLSRADSTTLGSFFVAKKGHRSSSARSTAFPSSPLAKTFPDMGPVDQNRPILSDFTSSASSSEEMLPEIDDFDIFYQDLTQGLGSSPGSIGPTTPIIYVPDGHDDLEGGPEGAAPSPSIHWTPQKRPVVATALR